MHMGGVEVWIHSFFTTALDEVSDRLYCPSPSNIKDKSLLRNEQEVLWAPETTWLLRRGETFLVLDRKSIHDP